MNGTIRDKMIEAAQNTRVIYYAELGELLDFSMDNPHHRTELGRILGEISTEEDSNCRPLLSAVVVHKEDHRPGEGFFKLAKELGKQKPYEDDDTFYSSELQRVFDEWAAEGQ